MAEISFIEPNLTKVRFVYKYKIQGIAIIEGYEKTIGFTLHYEPINFYLVLEDKSASIKLYNFFNFKFKPYCIEHKKLYKKSDQLHADWRILKENLNDVIKTLGNSMGSDWQDKLKKIISVYWPNEV